MDRVSMTDRLQSSTPTGRVGPKNSSTDDPQRKRPRRGTRTSDPDDAPDVHEEGGTHQIDELA